MKKYMGTYTFTDGFKCTSKLDKPELMKRMKRLDNLRVLTEGFTEGAGRSICDKALRAYHKADNFTGIIRLTVFEKDFLGYLLEGRTDEKDVETIQFYLK